MCVHIHFGLCECRSVHSAVCAQSTTSLLVRTFCLCWTRGFVVVHAALAGPRASGRSSACLPTSSQERWECRSASRSSLAGVPRTQPQVLVSASKRILEPRLRGEFPSLCTPAHRNTALLEPRSAAHTHLAHLAFDVGARDQTRAPCLQGTHFKDSPALVMLCEL